MLVGKGITFDTGGLDIKGIVISFFFVYSILRYFAILFFLYSSWWYYGKFKKFI